MRPLSSKTTLILVILISFIYTFPWLNQAPFNTKGEPREAICAQSMLTTNDWILPERYDGIYATKPPFTHWLMGATAKISGQSINEGISRFPSALAAFILSISFFLFVRKRKNNLLAFLSFLLFYSSIDIHRTAMTARVDMLLTLCIVSAIFSFSHWVDKELKGFPWLFTLFLSLGFLTKGPVGVILPCFIFTIYAYTRGISVLRITKALFIAAIPSVILPLLWYLLAYQQGGSNFADIVFEENFARFLGKMSYPSHNNPFYYPIIYTILGIMPWSVLLLFTLPVLSYKKSAFNLKRFNTTKLNSYWLQFKNLEKIDQLATISIFCILLFYMIPSSKRAVYQLPAYPFICYYIAQAFLKIANRHKTVVRCYGSLITLIIVTVLLLFPIYHLLPIKQLAPLQSISFPLISWVTYGLLLIITVVTSYFLIRYQAKKTLFSIIFMVFTLNLFLDNTILSTIKKQQSNKPFAVEINQNYPAQQLYGYNQTFWQINFYLDKKIKQFSQDHFPQTPFLLLITEKELELFKQKHPAYHFKQKVRSLHKNKSLKDFVLLVEIGKSL